MNNQIKDIQYLREKTGFGIMDCKEALKKSDGDREEAYKLLEERGLLIQEKKAERCSEEGIVLALTTRDAGAIVEVSAETDFVSKSPDFIASVEEIARTIAAGNDADELIKGMVMRFRENIRLVKSDTIKGNNLYAYNHGGGKYAVVLNAVGERADESLMKDLALQIIASAPSYVSKDDIPFDVLAEISGGLKALIAEDQSLKGKSDAVLDKIYQGRLDKWQKSTCLLDQPFIKDEAVTVGELLAGRGNVKVGGFHRYEKSEASNKCPCANNMFIG